MAGIFVETRFLVVQTSQESDSYIKWVVLLIEKNGGEAHVIQDNDTLEPKTIQNTDHVITTTYEFHDFAAFEDLLIPITSPEWLEDSVLASQKKNFRLYLPVPLPFMDKVVACIADNLPEGDKEVMYAGVKAFGGLYLDALLRYTTHLIAVDLSNNKSVVASNVKKQEDLEIKIVLPHWIDDCIRSQKRVDETPYLLSDSIVLRTGKPNFPTSTVISDEIPDIENSAHSRLLENKTVYLANDYNLSEHLQDSIHSLIRNCGGTVAEKFDVDEVSIYIGKYRSGADYKQVLSKPLIDVGSLSWLYSIVKRKDYIRPLELNLLHFPVPKGDLPGIANTRISITGYSGDARHYLTKLITAMGGTFTKTLDCKNDYLVTAKHRGEKYNAVKTRWPEIKIVNHLWIEECFAKWKYLDPKDKQYTDVNSSTKLLGLTRVDLSQTKINSRQNLPALDVDDTEREEDDQVNELKEVEENVNSAVEDNSDDKEKEELDIDEEELDIDEEENDIDAGEEGPVDEEKIQPAQVSSPVKVIEEIHQKLPSSDALIVMENATSESTPHRSSRSAKEKATKKLHTSMEELNEYLQVSKSLRKMKSYMEQLERDAAEKRQAARKAEKRCSPDAEETTPKETQSMPQKKKPKSSSPKETHVLAIMTGCEQELVLNRADVVKLGKLGISIVNDYSSTKPIDTIFAPRILRTEKFLKCLSKCSRIVHPRYLSEVLGTIKNSPDCLWEDLEKRVNIKYYLLDKIVPIKEINDDLGVLGSASGLENLLNSPLKGQVFADYSLNLSSNLNGGPNLIASILEEHGLKDSKTVKLTGSTSKKSLALSKNGQCIVVGHKSKDKKAAQRLAEEQILVVEWDWCVKSIFKQEPDSLENYRIR